MRVYGSHGELHGWIQDKAVRNENPPIEASLVQPRTTGHNRYASGDRMGEWRSTFTNAKGRPPSGWRWRQLHRPGP